MGIANFELPSWKIAVSLRGAELLGFDVPLDAKATDILHVAREVIKINLEVLQETLTAVG